MAKNLTIKIKNNNNNSNRNGNIVIVYLFWLVGGDGWRWVAVGSVRFGLAGFGWFRPRFRLDLLACFA